MNKENVLLFDRIEAKIKRACPEILIIREDYQTDYDVRTQSVKSNIFDKYFKSVILTETSYGNPDIIGFWSFWEKRESPIGKHETTFVATLGVESSINENVIEKFLSTFFEWYDIPFEQDDWRFNEVCLQKRAYICYTQIQHWLLHISDSGKEIK